MPVFLEFKQPSQQKLETSGEGSLPKPASHSWHVEIHKEGQVRWCQVQSQGIQSRRAESLGMGVGGKGTCLRGAWDKGGLRGKVPELGRPGGYCSAVIPRYKKQLRGKGKQQSASFFFFTIIRYKTLSVNFSILGLLNNI